MKKYIFVAAFIMFFVASPAFASNAYEPVNGECLNGDLEVYNHITYDVDSCLPKVDVDKANAESEALRTDNTLISILSGQSVMTSFGIVDTCPAWFPFGCTITPALFVSFI